MESLPLPDLPYPLLGALAGLIAGSFIGVVVTRWPVGGDFVRGRSRCDGCGRTLAAWELVPLVGFALLRGRCRGCGGAIAVLLPLVELGGAAIGGWAAVVAAANSSPVLLLWAPFGWLLLALALLDARHFWLPDRLTLPLAALGLLFAALRGAPLAGLIGAGAGWALLVLVGALYERARGRAGLGGGDPKLLGAIGAWTGPAALPFVLLLASVAGLGYVLALRLAGGRPTRRTRLPLGTLLAVAALAFVMLFGAPRGPAGLGLGF